MFPWKTFVLLKNKFIGKQVKSNWSQSINSKAQHDVNYCSAKIATNIPFIISKIEIVLSNMM
jgi:hypothetical protein